MHLISFSLKKYQHINYMKYAVVISGNSTVMRAVNKTLLVLLLLSATKT